MGNVEFGFLGCVMQTRHMTRRDMRSSRKNCTSSERIMFIDKSGGNIVMMI